MTVVFITRMTRPKRVPNKQTSFNACVLHPKVSGIRCDYGYDGTPVTTKCSTDGAPYNISGCTKIEKCYRPGTWGYNFTNVTEQLQFNGNHKFSVSTACSLPRL